MSDQHRPRQRPIARRHTSQRHISQQHTGRRQPQRLQRAGQAGAVLLALGLLMATIGCQPEPSATGTASAAPSTSAKAAASSKPASPYADGDLKVAEDFAAEADKEITAENYKEKLAEMTQEIDPKAAGSAAPDGSAQAAPPDGSAKAGATGTP